MITGDSKETAISIAKELKIIAENADIAKTCFTGAEFEVLSEAQKKKILSGSTGKVFSRVEPRHKRELVKILISMVSLLVDRICASVANLIFVLGRNRCYDWRWCQ